MQFLEALLRNPVKVAVGVLLVSLFGIIAMVTMPKQLTPEVETPVLRIETRWPGASPQEIEREIVQEQEEQLKSVEGLIKMSSECMDSEGRITLEFIIGMDIDEAMLKVNTRLQQVREYPIDALEPMISTRNVSDRAIARFVLTARPPTKEQVATFAEAHPDLKEALQPVVRAANPGLAVFRLNNLYEEIGEEHPELKEVMPAEIDLQKLRRFAENVIETRLERVPGVADAEVYGGMEEELQVVVDPARLAARQLTIDDVRRVLQSQNQDTSGGDLWEGKRRWVVRTLGQFRSPEQVGNQLLAVRDGMPVYIRDVAEVAVGYKKPTSISRRYGVSSNGLSVQRQTGANVLEVMQGLREATVELNEGVLKHRNLELYQYYDETTYINAAISRVQQNIFIGGALTMIVLMLFLHRGLRTMLLMPLIAATAMAAAYISPWYALLCLALIVGAGFWYARGALIVGLAIPISIVGTFLLLGIAGRSLNVISLAGMSFAVGMLVDNAVVVLENIHRRFQLGESAMTAAARGTQEVWGAVVASTLTTIAVFLPVVFVEEMSGQLFRDIALAISFAVGLSLIVSFTVIPTAASRLFRVGGEKRPEQDSSNNNQNGNGRKTQGAKARSAASSVRKVSGILGKFGTLFVEMIVGINRWIQHSKIRSVAVVLLLLGVSIALSYQFWPKVEYLPGGNRNFVFMFISPPPGYNMDQLLEMGTQIEEELQPYWDLDEEGMNDKNSEYPGINYYFYVVRGRRVFMGARSADPKRVHELIPLLKEVGSKFPGTIGVAKQSSLFERGITGGRTIDVEITGPDLKELVTMGQKVLGQVKQIMPEAQALPQPSLDLSSPEIHLEPRLVEAAEMGVTAQELGYTVNSLVDGAYAGDYFVGGEKIDVTIMGSNSTETHTHDLASLPIATPTGQLVPLGALADITLQSGPEQINRRERLRAITIQVSPPPEIPLEEARERIEQEIVNPILSEIAVDGEYMINISGTADKLEETWEALKWNLALALAITYLLMAALFESWLYPFVIILTVPLGAVGGLLGLRFLNVFILQPLDVLTMLGFIILIGTVVNNAILIVHQSLHHMRVEGMTPKEAIPESVRNRIRPIFITTMTTVLGLLPLVLFPGEGSELYRGLGSVVLGGLLVSTIFTLILVPTVFTLTLGVKQYIVDFPNRRKRVLAAPGVAVDAESNRDLEKTVEQPEPEPAVEADV